MSSESEGCSASDDEDYVPPGVEDSEDELEKKTEDASEKEEEQETEDQKKKLDEVWKDFKKETKQATDSNKDNANMNEKNSNRTKDTVTVTKVYDFAGEEVKVTKEVAANSAEGQKAASANLNKTKSVDTTPLGRLKRSGAGGIHSVLGKLGKKPKLSTLEKSKLDWMNFKEEKGIHEELNSYKKGKDGYLEKQSFLQRTDLRQFENERDMRLGRGSNRR